MLTEAIHYLLKFHSPEGKANMLPLYHILLPTGLICGLRLGDMSI